MSNKKEETPKYVVQAVQDTSGANIKSESLVHHDEDGNVMETVFVVMDGDDGDSKAVQLMDSEGNLMSMIQPRVLPLPPEFDPNFKPKKKKIKQQKNIERKKHGCDKCEKSFKFKSSLKSHQSIAHEGAQVRFLIYILHCSFFLI